MAESSKWVSVSDAARLTGLSVRTIKRMADEGKLTRSKTPGGHLRVMRAQLDSLLRQDGPTSSSSGPISNALKNRRDQVQELNLEAEELKAKREIKKLREEDSEIAHQRSVEILTRQRAVEEARLQREREADRRRRDHAMQEAQEKLASFERYWLRWVSTQVPDWLSVEQLQIVQSAVKVELSHYDLDGIDIELIPALESIMRRVIAPWAEEREQRTRRENLIDLVVRREFYLDLSDQARGISAARIALSKVPLSAPEWEVRIVLDEAIRPIKDEKGRT